jgi:NADH:ubiquinone oxidoreductase subunit 6 (subunit J)
MTLSFAIIAVLTIAAAVAAMSLRNLVHCALALALSFAGLAAAYLQLGAQFVGFTQLLVYVGAVAILIVFAILLTRNSETNQQRFLSRSWLGGLIVAVLVLGVLVWAINHSSVMGPAAPRMSDDVMRDAGTASVKRIGETLMQRFVLPMEVVGLLLTAALIGAVIIAMKESSPSDQEKSGTNHQS